MLLTAFIAGSGATIAAGFPDPTFGTGGVFVSTLSGNQGPRDGLIDSQGRYVSVGSRVAIGSDGSFVFRIGTGGTPDTSFNGSGNVLLVGPPGSAALVLVSVQQQGDGKLVVAGRVGPNFGSDDSARPYVCRLLDNGSLDPAFGNGGCTMQPFVAAATAETVADLALQTDGRIVLAGSSVVGGVRRTAVLRLNANGSRDLCFNDPVNCTSGGSVYNPMPGNPITTIQAIALQPDGKIVLVGTGQGPQSIDMIAVRLLPTGAVDAAFGNAGSRLIAFEIGGTNFDIASAVVVLSDGGIVLAGSATDTSSSGLAAVVKLTQSGQFDLFFGPTGTGRSTTFYTDVTIRSQGSDITVQNDGKLVVGGTSFLGLASTEGDFAAWRLLANGFTDTAFGFDGRITVTTGADPENTQGVSAIDTDGRHVVLFGFRRLTNQSFNKAAIVRLDIDGVFRDGFEGL